uniref:Micro-fibrillar-associated protein 1 C-terminal domain-containing protein n=1 Tax=Oryza glumipatula TaxID=40148 RepID=A0A0E0BGU9_9ORYZ
MARIKKGREQSSIDDKSMEDENPVADHPKKQMRSMQKYYHKGSFFQQDADNATQTAGVEGEGDEGEDTHKYVLGLRVFPVKEREEAEVPKIEITPNAMVDLLHFLHRHNLL